MRGGQLRDWTGNPVSIASSGIALYGALSNAAWAGPVGLGVAVAGAIVGGLFGNDPPPAITGKVQPIWGRDGQLHLDVHYDTQGGGAQVAQIAQDFASHLQQQLEQAAPGFSLIPSALPSIAYYQRQDGSANPAPYTLSWLDEQGAEHTSQYGFDGKALDGAGDLATDYAHIATQYALVPQQEAAYMLDRFIEEDRRLTSGQQDMSDGDEYIGDRRTAIRLMRRQQHRTLQQLIAHNLPIEDLASGQLQRSRYRHCAQPAHHQRGGPCPARHGQRQALTFNAGGASQMVTTNS